jgi:hypothetical protein
MENKETIVFIGEGQWGRKAYIKLVNDKVIFDCSNEEYGPIKFDIKILIDELNKHINKK